MQYSRTLFNAEAAYSVGKNTISLRLKGGSNFGANMPYYDQLALGGFLNPSGYAYEQFRGNDMAFGSLVYYRQIALLTPPLGHGLYLGASLETGWLSDGDFGSLSTGKSIIISREAARYGGSLFFGSDTWIGLAFLVLGVTSTGESTIYVLIGRL